MKNPIKYLLTGILIIIFSITPANATCNTQTIGNNLEMKFTGLAQGMAQQVVINSVPGAGEAWQVIQIAQCFSGGVTVCGMNLAASQLESAAWTEIGNHIGPEATQVLQNVKDICGEAKDVEINKEGEVEIKQGGHIKVDDEETDLSEIWGFEEGKVSGKNVKITSEDIETEEDGYIQVWGEKTDIGKMFGLEEGEISFDNAKITGSKDNPNIKTIETTSASTMDFKKYGIENVEFSKGTKFTIKTSEKDDGSKNYLIDRIQDEVTNFNGELAGLSVTKGNGKIFFIAKSSELASGEISDKDYLSLPDGAEAVGFTNPSTAKNMEYLKVKYFNYQRTDEGIKGSFHPRQSVGWETLGTRQYQSYQMNPYPNQDSFVMPQSEDVEINFEFTESANNLRISSPKERLARKIKWFWGQAIENNPATRIETKNAIGDMTDVVGVSGDGDLTFGKDGTLLPILDGGSYRAIRTKKDWPLDIQQTIGMVGLKENQEPTKIYNIPTYMDKESEDFNAAFEDLISGEKGVIMSTDVDAPKRVVAYTFNGDFGEKGQDDGKGVLLSNGRIGFEIKGDAKMAKGVIDGKSFDYFPGIEGSELGINTKLNERDAQIFDEVLGKFHPLGPKPVKEDFINKEVSYEDMNLKVYLSRQPSVKKTFADLEEPEKIEIQKKANFQGDSILSIKNEEGNIIGARAAIKSSVVKDSLVDAQFKSFAGQDPFVKQAGIKPEELSAKTYIQENFGGYNDVQRLKKVLITTYNDQLLIAKDGNLPVADRQTANLEMAKIKKALLQRDELLVKYSLGK